MKTRNLMAAFAFALCLGLGAYENFDAAYKDAQRLEKENKNPEALGCFAESGGAVTGGLAEIQSLCHGCKYSPQDAETGGSREAGRRTSGIGIESGTDDCSASVECPCPYRAEKTADAAAELRKIIAVQEDFEPYYLYAGATFSLNQLNDPGLAGEFIRKFNANKRNKAEWMLNRVKGMAEKIEKKR